MRGGGGDGVWSEGFSAVGSCEDPLRMDERPTTQVSCREDADMVWDYGARSASIDDESPTLSRGMLLCRYSRINGNRGPGRGGADNCGE